MEALAIVKGTKKADAAKKAFQELADYDARARWLGLPYIGCDGVPKTGQAWVRSGLLAATVVTPPLAGQALEMMAQARKTSSMPPELTLVPPRSFPALESLARLQEDRCNILIIIALWQFWLRSASLLYLRGKES